MILRRLRGIPWGAVAAAPLGLLFASPATAAMGGVTDAAGALVALRAARSAPSRGQPTLGSGTHVDSGVPRST